MQLGFLPRLTIRHTSRREIGQIYVPAVNGALFAVVIAIVIGFGSSTALASAYGVAVTGTFILNTILFLAVARLLWHTPRRWIALGGVVFLSIEVTFFAANLTKVAHGGWLPLAIAAMVFTILMTWRRGREIVSRNRGREEGPLQEFIDELQARRGELVRVPGTAVFLNSHANTTPIALRANVEHNHVLHERVIIVSLQTERVPHVYHADRLTCDELGHAADGITGMTVRIGFQDAPNVPAMLEPRGSPEADRAGRARRGLLLPLADHDRADQRAGDERLAQAAVPGARAQRSQPGALLSPARRSHRDDRRAHRPVAAGLRRTSLNSLSARLSGGRERRAKPWRKETRTDGDDLRRRDDVHRSDDRGARGSRTSARPAALARPAHSGSSTATCCRSRRCSRSAAGSPTCRAPRRTLIIGVIAFALFSALCGATPTGSAGRDLDHRLRVLQGASRGVPVPGGAGDRRRQLSRSPSAARRWRSSSRSPAALTAVGPIAGGYLTEWTWRSIFWINVPIALIAIVLTIISKPSRSPSHDADRLRGAVPVGLRHGARRARTAAGRRVGLVQRRRRGRASSSGSLLIAAFVLWELRVDQPLVPMRLFAQPRLRRRQRGAVPAVDLLRAAVLLRAASTPRSRSARAPPTPA